MCDQEKELRYRICYELEHLLTFEMNKKMRPEDLPGLKRARALVVDYKVGRVGCARAGDELRQREDQK